MATMAPLQTRIASRRGYPIKDESCKVECPECGTRAQVDHTDSERTWWKCPMDCGGLFGINWPQYASKPRVPTITETEGLV